MVKYLPAMRQIESRFYPWVMKIPWRREWQPTLVFLPEKSHGQRRPAGNTSWGCKELDTTEQLTHTHTHTHTHTILSYIWGYF